MYSYTDTIFVLAREDRPVICAHQDSVSLCLHAGHGDGRGVTLRFTKAQVGAVRELLQALEALPELGEPFGSDETPA